jgi:hypothetical protein
MKNIIILFIFMSSDLYSQRIQRFENINFNTGINYCQIDTNNSCIVTISSSANRPTDTLNIVQFNNNSSIKWHKQYFSGTPHNFHVQKVIAHNGRIVILIDVVSYDYSKPFGQETKSGLILCYNTNGFLEWNKMTDSKPISAIFTDNNYLLIGYMYNYLDPMIRQFDFIGFSLFDIKGNEKHNLRTNNVLKYSELLFKKGKENNIIEVFYDNDDELTKKKIVVVESIEIIDECSMKNDFILSYKIKLKNKDVVGGTYYDRLLRKRNLRFKFFDCGDTISTSYLFKPFEINHGIWISNNYIALSNLSETKIIELDKNTGNIKNIYKVNIDIKYHVHNIIIDEKENIAIWLGITNSDYNYYKLGIMTINLKDLKKT